MRTSVKVGDIFAGKYKVESVLGKGGMGLIIAARHMMLGERCAIKILLPHARADDQLVTRLLREGQAAARIRSEHVARVFDVGTLSNNEPYLVMEYLDGSDLGTIIRKRGALLPDEVCEYVLQACEALAEAHALGIIHRDLKPSNLFLTQRADGAPLIKLIDFGISKITAQAGEPWAEPQSVDMTQTDVMMGSPRYMAPEQMHSAKHVDVRSDIWSIGVIMYQLLAGKTPFSGASVMEIFEHILAGATPLRKLRADVPKALEAVVLKCLQKNPDDRWQNVAELASALAEHAPPHARISAERVARVLGEAPPSRAGGPASRGSPASSRSAPPSSRSSPASSRSAPPSSWSAPAQPPTQLRRSSGVMMRILASITFTAAVGTAGGIMLPSPVGPIDVALASSASVSAASAAPSTDVAKPDEAPPNVVPAPSPPVTPWTAPAPQTASGSSLPHARALGSAGAVPPSHAQEPRPSPTELNLLHAEGVARPAH